MDNIIAVFTNRNQAMQFASYLKKMGVRSRTISTPRELSVSCGISVLFPKSYIKQANSLIRNYGLMGFVKLYQIVTNDVSKKYHAI